MLLLASHHLLQAICILAAPEQRSLIIFLRNTTAGRYIFALRTQTRNARNRNTSEIFWNHSDGSALLSTLFAINHFGGKANVRKSIGAI